MNLNVYGYGTDYSETDLGEVKFDLNEIEGDTVDYCHAVVQEQLGVNLNQYRSAIFMDSKLMELRDKYVDGESMADLLAELGGGDSH